MARVNYQPYWIWPGPSDPLPNIGQGLRLVSVAIGRKWVKVRSESAYQRVSKRRWTADVPNVPESETDGSLGSIIEAFKRL